MIKIYKRNFPDVHNQRKDFTMNGDCLIFALLYLFVGIVTVFPHFKKQWKTLQVWKHRRTVFCIVAIGSVAIAPIGLFFMLFFHAFYGRPSDTKKQE